MEKEEIDISSIGGGEKNKYKKTNIIQILNNCSFGGEKENYIINDKNDSLESFFE